MSIKTIANSPVFSIIKKNECCGCEACVSICPCNCLKMIPDKEGFMFPYMDVNKCISCNKCVRVCPVINTEKNKLLNDMYAGYANNDVVVKNSASGGAFTLIVNAFLEKNEEDSIVCGVIWSEDFKSSKHIISRGTEKMPALLSSKYVQSLKGNIYIEIQNFLKKGKAVLFSGTPCEIAGLKRFLGKDYENLITLDIVCQGPTTPKAMHEFVDSLEKKYHSSIINLNMRYVYRTPWIPQWLRIEFENGKTFQKLFYETEIGRAVHILQRWSCYDCKFCGYNRASDITIGDFHGAKSNEKYYNACGTSIIINNTEKGKELFNLISVDEINLYKIDYDLVTKTNPRILNSWNPHEKRTQFGRWLSEFGLHYAVNKSRTTRQKLRLLIPYELRVKVQRFKKKHNQRKAG